MTADFSHLEAQIRAARAEFDDAVERALRDMARFQRDNAPTQQEYRDLQEAAARGDLGDDMRELARRIERGDDSWDAVFSGESPNSELLGSTVDHAIAANQEAIVQAFEEDEDFDPSRPDPDS